MRDLDLVRLEKLEQRCREIAQEFGLATRDISFEIVTAQKMFELLAYHLPGNYSHWGFGRDYERERTIYERTGEGIPQEMILNTDPPRAFLVETNPLAVNILVMAHCFGHDDCFAQNEYLKYARTLSNVDREAYNAAERFAKYEEKYGVNDL
jgi:stage V sporulation protein R